MDIFRFNHWWTQKSVRHDLVGKKRQALDDLINFLPKRQMLLLKGLRRVGKTTLMYQLIDQLLMMHKLEPVFILYFSFDQEVEEIEDILMEYSQKVLRKNFEDVDERCYIFLDEIHKLPNWANQLKVFYDLYPNLKFIISGSASINVTKSAKESLAGRVYDFHIWPLNFDEYLKFKGIEVEADRPDLYQLLIEPQVHTYLRSSGFIEMLDEDDPAVLSKYFRESILERVVYQDLPESFLIREPALLLQLLRVIASHPGLLIEFHTLANEFKRDQRTIAQYCDYLKYVFFLKPLYFFSRNMITSEKKLKKYYLSQTAFVYSLLEPYTTQLDEGVLLENLFISLLDCDFFYRSTTKEEVDMVQTDPELLPIEVKYRKQIAPRDLRGIKSFMRRYSCRKGLVITRGEERHIQTEIGTIQLIPYWKVLLQYKRRLTEMPKR